MPQIFTFVSLFRHVWKFGITGVVGPFDEENPGFGRRDRGTAPSPATH